jgi:hypothetical protein
MGERYQEKEARLARELTAELAKQNEAARAEPEPEPKAEPKKKTWTKKKADA